MLHEEPAARTGKHSYLLLGGAIILGLLVGLGIGMAVAGEAEPEPEFTLPAAVQEFHSDWFQAWNDADGDTALAMMTPDGRHYCPGSGTDGVSGEALTDFVDKGFSVADVEISGAISMDTPGESSEVSRDHVIVTQLTLDGHEGYVSILHIRGAEDSLRVLTHRAFPERSATGLAL